MANDVANIILKKTIEMQDRDQIYLFNGNLYKKKDSTSHNDFIKHIIKQNYAKCVKLLFKQRQKIGSYIVSRGVVEGEISVENYENNINLHDFHLNIDEFKKLKSRFETNRWNIFHYCDHPQPRQCLCETSRCWLFKNKEDDIELEDNGENDIFELKENEEHERVVWGNMCNICHKFIEAIRDDCEICDCGQSEVDCYCDEEYEECEECSKIVPSQIIVSPKEKYYSDHCGLFKHDLYNIFISAGIDILKQECMCYVIVPRFAS